jgi:nitroreductase
MKLENQMLLLLRSLRATRRFLDQAVPENTIDQILETARWTGSARNRQPWRFAVVTDRDQLRAFSRLGAYADHVALAPAAILIAVNEDTGGVDAEFDAGRIAQTILLAAEALGLGACPATLFPDDNIRKANKLAGVNAPWRIRTVIALGYPALSPPGKRTIPSGRLPLQALKLPLPDKVRRAVEGL